MQRTPPDPGLAPTTDPVAVARGLIAAAMGRGASMPDSVALDLADAWDALEVPTALPTIVAAPDEPLAPTELLLRARIALRQALTTVTPARRAVRLGYAIRHLDTALARLDGWTDGGSQTWR